ncbi:hypothetical protein CONPUDRAFT_139658 [Coniophora puteana RWD-64-598 SS2]|uniref:F-box domain-containing protein n=1 Tax=Coniophora puteana (strain RWD-64-598) TaxID=741705 RepID=A0A5M3MAC3_CONPW|nr:uncharacterized protein CONPUDRAFT_139658 [Coniophora puteana RWD-64-598 SS2]EIW76232.1 hypothetical protein CONPUDRAFT_139658 [Coniophora puteana RWD-64-598 SS2]
MCWADGTAVLFDDIFCSPSLRYFEVRGDAFTVLKRMPSLVNRCPLLETFKAINPNFKRPATGSRSIEPSVPVTKAVCAWKHLRDADCGLMSPEMLSRIAHLPRLNSLSIDVYAQSKWIIEDDTFGMPAVNRLNIRADRYSTCGKALDLLFKVSDKEGPNQNDLASVTALSVIARVDCPSDPAIFAFANSLATSVSPASLSSLDILMNDQRGDDTDYLKTGAYPSLRPLTAFTQLTSFSCNSYTNHVFFKGLELLDLAKSWPLVEFLSVRRVRQPLRITELAELLRCCKHLRVLDTEILVKNADVMTVYREVVLEDARGSNATRNEHINKALFRIPAGGSRTPGVEWFAPLLEWLFPRLVTIRMMSEAHIEFWCQVAECVEVLGQRPAGEVKIELWEM